MSPEIQTTTNGALKPNGEINPTLKKQSQTSRSSDLSYVDRTIQSTTATVTSLANYSADRSVKLLNQVSSPEQRDAIITQTQDFALANPQLSAFIGVNLLFTGIPLIIFIGFSISTLIFSIVAGLLLGLLGALLFTGSAVALALAILLPTIAFSTIAATTVFIWGLAAFYAIRWFNGTRRNQRNIKS